MEVNHDKDVEELKLAADTIVTDDVIMEEAGRDVVNKVADNTNNEEGVSETKAEKVPLNAGFKMPSMLPPKLSRLSDPSPPTASKTSPSTPVTSKEATTCSEQTSETLADTSPDVILEPDKPVKSPAELAKAKAIPVPYQEPSWGGLPEKEYRLEVLKNGTIVDTIQLKDKSFFVAGRLASCDLVLEHPSLSRYHAVLQFKNKGSPEKPVGFYLFDLDSTHGSFHNKNKCFPKTYYRLRVGHMIKLGLSTRSLILQGPEDDSEEESEFTLTELKAKATEKARLKLEEKLKNQDASKEETEEVASGDGGGGASWGMGDDADEFPDMEKNPFAETADNESLYINDPKKALQNWFDREGYDLEYEVEEKGYAQFLCKIDLPVDNPTGRGSTTAEALVKGKKKESTVAAALEACRILDRLGLLRPSQQSAIERKVKKWEEDDFYASDDDEFLDRTGSIQRKRKNRMKMAGKEKETVETYDSLMKKFEENKTLLVDTEAELKEAVRRRDKAGRRSENNDLDSYLAELKRGAQVDKETIQKLKIKVMTLNQEQERLTKLINIARPASMPTLNPAPKPDKSKYAGIMVGKRGSKGLLGKVKNVINESKAPAVVVNSTDTKVLEAFLRDSEDQLKPKRSRLEDEGSGDELQPIGYEPKPEPKTKERIGDVSVNTPARTIGPSIPQELRDKIPTESKALDVGVENKPAEVRPEQTSDAIVAPSQPPTPDVNAMAEDYEKEKKKRGDRGNKRRKRPDEEEEPEEYYKVGMDKKYDVWVPPSNQTGDGRTSLNDKLGY